MMTMTEELVITKHAYTRMKERNGWNKKAATRMVSKIYNDGLDSKVSSPEAEKD